MKTVQILFIKSVMKDIRDSVDSAKTQGGEYTLPDNFDQVGQTFENVSAAYVDDSFFMVEVADRKDENKKVEYYYPAHSIARVKVAE